MEGKREQTGSGSTFVFYCIIASASSLHNMSGIHCPAQFRASLTIEQDGWQYLSEITDLRDIGFRGKCCFHVLTSTHPLKSAHTGRTTLAPRDNRTQKERTPIGLDS